MALGKGVGGGVVDILPTLLSLIGKSPTCLRDYLNTERSYKKQRHASLKHFVGFPVQWWKVRITVA